MNEPAMLARIIGEGLHALVQRGVLHSSTTQLPRTDSREYFAIWTVRSNGKHRTIGGAMATIYLMPDRPDDGKGAQFWIEGPRAYKPGGGPDCVHAMLAFVEEWATETETPHQRSKRRAQERWERELSELVAQGGRVTVDTYIRWSSNGERFSTRIAPRTVEHNGRDCDLIMDELSHMNLRSRYETPLMLKYRSCRDYRADHGDDSLLITIPLTITGGKYWPGLTSGSLFARFDYNKKDEGESPTDTTRGIA